MIIQYPHKMVITVTTPATQDANGNWLPGSTTTIEKACRAEPNGSNGYIIGDDGARIDYAWTVYMPLPAVSAKTGAKVKVYNGIDLFCTDTVKRLSVGQLNARIWL